MPAIPVFSASPINASQAEGATPQTARPEESQKAPEAPTTTTSAAASQQGYPAPQPAAAPSLPAQTGAPQPAQDVLQPTPTQSLHDAGPPAPQPGAVPVPPSGVASHLPPPPKAGESQQVPQTTATSMPPQMSYPAPNATFPSGAGSSTVTASLPSGPRPTSLQEAGPAQSYSHPPGYHQDVHASDFSSHQRAAHDASLAQNSGTFDDGGDDESVWNTAKKWATAAGNSLAAAENEVWRRINKD